tara:strand:+ start:82 stop:273 length:192 start_codon:yes stop_codon:yes gene_type:complete
MNSTHGPVDITAMMRSQRNNPTEFMDQKKNITSSRGRNPQLNSTSKDNAGGVHLPPMPLTPTE